VNREPPRNPGRFNVRNRRLYDAIDQWAFCALNSSPGARAFYDLTAPLATCTTKRYAPWATAWAHRHTNPDTQVA
jgi:hypothetical protein